MDKLREKINSLLSNYPEARKFVILYHEYAHDLDDIIDKKITDAEFILKVADLASEVYSCKFYRDNVHILRYVDFMCNNSYADSVVWEQPEQEEFKRIAAGTLRHTGLDMFFATVAICCGREKMREISAEMREFTFKAHINEKGENI